MKTLVIAALKDMTGCRGSLKEIKYKMLSLFPEKFPEATLAKGEWEQTFTKIFSKHKGLFIKSPAVYKLEQKEFLPEDTAGMFEPSYDQEMAN